MKDPKTFEARLAGIAMLAALMALSGCSKYTGAPLNLASSPATVRQHELLQFAWRSSGVYRNPFIDVVLDAEFVSPDGSRIKVPGFYYGGGEWRVRLRPATPGPWKMHWTSSSGVASQGDAAFECVASEQGLKPIHRNPEHPFRWVDSSGVPYFPMGLQEGTSPEHPGMRIDGNLRTDSPPRTPLPRYFRLYQEGGFNLFRFSQRNASYLLFDTLDEYREQESLFTDTFFETMRSHRFRLMFGFFGYHSSYQIGWDPLYQLGLKKPEEAVERPDDQVTFAKEKRFVRYCIARWGAYADFWELLNERNPADKWVSAMANYVHAIDPDHKPIGTSWERPGIPEIDLNTPHWYRTEEETESDLVVVANAKSWKAYGKPVLVGEQGNSSMNWDPRSAIRMRIRLWTALFQEIGLIFWHTGWSKSGMHQGVVTPGGASNIYIGPEERSYTRVLSAFSARLDSAVKMIPVQASGPVGAYGLASPKVTAVYLQHHESHTTPVRGTRLTIPVPGSNAKAEWIDPATGKVLSTVTLHQGEATLTAPEFPIDLALIVEKD